MSIVIEALEKELSALLEMERKGTPLQFPYLYNRKLIQQLQRAIEREREIESGEKIVVNKKDFEKLNLFWGIHGGNITRRSGE